MQALLRYPKRRRRAIAQEWARRSNAVQSAARIAREPDYETLSMRALHDAKGTILREGCAYTSAGETHWVVRRSVRGRVNQLDLVANGAVTRTCGVRKLPGRFRPVTFNL